MEFTSFAQFKFGHGIYKPFSLVSREKIYAIIGPESFVTILQNEYVPDSFEEFCFKIEYVTAPVGRAVTRLTEIFNLKKAYNRMGCLERQRITLDPLYNADFALSSQDDLDLEVINVEIPPSGMFITPIVAVISSFGVCEIRTKLPFQRNWGKIMINLNDIWSNLVFDYSNLQKKSFDFKIIRKYVEDHHITTCCWSKIPTNIENSCNFYCTTASGWVISLNIELPKKVTLNSKINTELAKINMLKIITHKKKEFLIVSDVNGVIKLILAEGNNNIKEVETLWSKQDKMFCYKFDAQILDKIGRMLIVTSKASHFLAFLIDSNGKLLAKSTHHIGGIQVTGFAANNLCEYFITTLDGLIKLVTITISADKNLKFDAVNISYNFDSTHYQILGFCPTINKAAWLFLLYPSSFTDTKVKNLCLLTICFLKKELALEVLKASESMNIEDYADCAEVIRTSILQNGPLDYFADYNPEPIQIADSFLNKLRIRLIVANSKLLYIRRKQRQKGENVETEVHSICSTIKAILIYKRLNHLLNLSSSSSSGRSSSSNNSLSEFQKLSGMCLRRTLLNYLKGDWNQQFAEIRDIFIPVLESLLERTEKIFEGKIEKCLYCGEAIDSQTGMCSDQHRMKRCCISYVQVPLLSANRCCKLCKEVSLNYDELLQQVLIPNEKIQCPIFKCPLMDTDKMLTE